ncbi:MAG TPA: hypothetical protein VGA32_04455, partial [Anaerolineales bacterium]
MLAQIGFFSVLFALLASLYGAAAAGYGAWRRQAAFVESARHAMLLTFPLLTLAAGALIGLLVLGEYQVEYVASVTSRA